MSNCHPKKRLNLRESIRALGRSRSQQGKPIGNCPVDCPTAGFWSLMLDSTLDDVRILGGMHAVCYAVLNLKHRSVLMNSASLLAHWSHPFLPPIHPSSSFVYYGDNEGALLNVFGSLLTAVCFGVLTIQISSYYHAFPNDGRPLKMVVGFLWNYGEGLSCPETSRYTVPALPSLYIGGSSKNDYNPLALARATWEFAIYRISTVCASVTAQTFFAHGVYSLSANLYLRILVVCRGFDAQ
ncbi:hypothetical protein BS47DRAFT_1367228 [Hydnum rufescens UP504]|uniref:Uncharacterized protein n=1 Tax=Hydnum rufescens UP504 TaxID=1448309 RepID=A0A9P6AJ47_9AGAM|nr:hypothetical protein BS47DRAFT_1367228 [Hydnum rufescens UP504]